MPMIKTAARESKQSLGLDKRISQGYAYLPALETYRCRRRIIQAMVTIAHTYRWLLLALASLSLG
ncbi:MAG TPA: hypothetical protein VN063_03225, partial [Methylophilaceae bacterium]|nr:hypothetical protein [Methylophilaceae bacterium]